MGKTYGVYISEQIDKMLSAEVTIRQLSKEKAHIDSQPKLIQACVFYVCLEGKLKEVDLPK